MIDHPRNGRFYLDTTVFCEAFEGLSEKAEPLQAIFELGKERPGRIVTSELTLAELAAGTGWAWYSRFYLNLLVSNRFIELKPISRSILVETGDYRRALQQVQRKMKLPDAIHAVTALASGCRYLMTSDKRFSVPQPLVRVGSEPADLRFVMQALDA